MKRILIAVGVLMGLVIGVPASASVNLVTLASKGTLSPDRTSITITGTTICSDGDTASATAIVTQSSGQTDAIGTGSSGDFICTGTTQTWAVVVVVIAGAPTWKKGKATVLAGVSDSTDGTSAIVVDSIHVH